MSKLSFLLRRLVNMDYSAMLETADEVGARCGRGRLPVLADMARCALRYQAGYLDYKLFEFESLTAAQRATYITRGRNNTYVKRLNQRESWHLFDDKIEFLRLFDGLHGRAWLDLRGADAAALAGFCAAHPRIVGKPVDGTCGRGIDFYTVDRPVEQAGELHRTLTERRQILVEQRVAQHPELARLHPRSLNTLRLVTIVTPAGEPELVFSCLRIGNGKEVDNLNSGGMSVMVDGGGVLCSPGADKNGLACEVHPLTNTTLPGTQLPFFEEAVALVKQAALRVPGIRFVGWDVGITEAGPILIEGNHFPGHDIYQFRIHLGPDRIGLAPRFDAAAGIVT